MKDFYIVLKGKIGLSKKLEYYDEKEYKLSKEECLLEVESKSLLGEDRILFGRNNTYTAKVLSTEADFFIVNGRGFLIHFKKVIKEMTYLAQNRNTFMDRRLK